MNDGEVAMVDERDGRPVASRPWPLIYVLTAAAMLGVGFASGRVVARLRAPAPAAPVSGAEGEATLAAMLGALKGADAPAGVDGRAMAPTPAAPPVAGSDTGGLSVGVVEPGMANLGDLAPTFRLSGPAPETIVDLADYAGKAVLLNFWATWCVPCRHEMPFLQALHDAHADAGDLAVVAVDVDEPAELVAPYLAELGLTFPVGLDVDGQVADTYRIGTYPTTYLLGRDGRIMSIKRGAYGSPYELEQAASLMLRP
jgi:thiol-disulfide isomerase/thioredoxin